ncbi:hypothetical protein [Glycomyces algeriensis]|uniref:Uncharacterized protein n=1 Tax=Glycomyces algeriensis TaxID=256037 RepID=A0A9W6LHC7_9ACTN|nr:hypothetical protein [Glycomyces algeriensis]MDA1365123.1 hypothetical protein [Glycomyces algeriensis]MDR7349815.1 hypothetical protein [Glycomyces algeriensis]GLI42526.1 hypothetical protein GALLR39Z86_23760 [Glycomyces algeriensis]
MSQQPNPYLLTVRLGTAQRVLLIVLGGLLTLLAVFALTLGGFSIYLILGPLFLLMGILSTTNPYLRFDTATGELGLYSPLGFKSRTYGAPKGESIYYQAATGKIMRALPNGTHRKVSTFGVDRNELARVIAALPQG